MQLLGNDISLQIQSFIDEHLKQVPELKAAYSAIEDAPTKTLNFQDGTEAKVLWLPKRRKSSGADMSKISERECFLCRDSLLSWQKRLEVGDYDILVNPYPIFPQHLTIVHHEHRPQRLDDSIVKDFVVMAFSMPDRILFYNGARCGASAPDHLHFQSVPNVVEGNFFAPYVGMECDETEKAIEFILASIESLRKGNSDLNIEPDFNLVALPSSDKSDTMRFLLFPRRSLRPKCYSADPESDGFMVSPASIEMLGVIVAPLEKDFNRLNADIVHRIYRDVCIYP